MNFLLLLQPLILNLQKEISLAEDVLVLRAPRLRPAAYSPAISASHSSPLRQPENPIRPFEFSARYFLLTRGLR